MRPLRMAVPALVFLGLSVPAYAQWSMGVRGGASADPKQAFVGFQLESKGLEPHTSLTFRPNVEVGFGSGETLVSTNLEFAFWVKFSDTWRGYFGGGPSVVYAHGGGVNSVFGSYDGFVGFQNRSGLFIEMKHGHGANPSLRVTVGLVLKTKK
jgi:hypothetical protein